MENGEESEQIFRQLKTQKSVQIVEDRSQIVEVREKHGPLYKAIPKMPVAGAVICCLLNIVAPGIGK